MGARRQRCVNTAWLLQPGARQALAVPCGCARWVSATSGCPTLNPVTRHRCAAALPPSPAAAPDCWGLDMSTLEQLGQCVTTCLQPELGAAARLTCGAPPAISVLWAAPQDCPGHKEVTGGESPWLMHVAEAESDKLVAVQT